MSRCPIRVAVVEDHEPTRESILLVLKGSPEVVCIGDYATTQEAEEAISANPPQVVLMDINLGSGSGIDCVRKLKALRPEIEFVMLTTYNDSDLIFAALSAGASGYLLKRSAAEHLIDSIKEVHDGGSPMSMEIARCVVEHIQGIKAPEPEEPQEELLSKRQREIVELLAEGLAYKQIADRLGLSAHTISNHLRNVYEKLQVQTRTEAVMKYFGKSRRGA